MGFVRVSLGRPWVDLGWTLDRYWVDSGFLINNVLTKILFKVVGGCQNVKRNVRLSEVEA